MITYSIVLIRAKEEVEAAAARAAAAAEAKAAQEWAELVALLGPLGLASEGLSVVRRLCIFPFSSSA